MKTIYGLKHLKRLSKGSVVTIGVFDGLHIGHRTIIKKVVAEAKKSGLSSVLITFDPHPAKVLRPHHNTPSLISLKHRIRLIEELGIDTLIVIKFTGSFSSMSPEKFVKNVLVGKLMVKRLLVGENFYFGAKADTGVANLRNIAKRHGFEVTVADVIKADGHIVSSSLIRKFIREGRLRQAERLLGRPVSVLGTVVKGSGIAKGLGCPTANINPHHEAIPPRGVYAVRARFGNKNLRGILNIGFRPTFYASRDEEPTIEVHLFGFRGNLYNKDIEVYFVRKMRDERKFTSMAKLIKQIERDMARAKSILSV